MRPTSTAACLVASLWLILVAAAVVAEDVEAMKALSILSGVSAASLWVVADRHRQRGDHYRSMLLSLLRRRSRRKRVDDWFASRN